MIIDTHTHLYLEKDYQDYLKRAENKISVMISMHHSAYDLNHVLEFADTKTNLYVVAAVDTRENIKKQLNRIEKYFKEEKIVGIKLYPGYRQFYPSDAIIYPVVEVCQKYNKPLIFHSGDLYNPKGEAMLKFSHPIHIDELAVKFPKCQIIIAHFGFPYLLEAANVVNKNENVYIDISGTIDDQKTEKDLDNLTKQYINDLQRVFAYFPEVKKKTIFGTDYSGEDSSLKHVQPYIKVVEKIFSQEEQEEVFSKLAKRLFFTPNHNNK